MVGGSVAASASSLSRGNRRPARSQGTLDIRPDHGLAHTPDRENNRYWV